MSHRVLPALVLAPLLLWGRADAGDPPAPAPARAADGEQQPGWHKQLAHRNARYASLARVDDPAGDLHESIMAHMNMHRVGDPVGDLEQVRVARATSKIPPRATADAFVARAQDALGDGDEQVLASGTFHRRFAETRRFRDIGGDQHELITWQRDRQDGLRTNDGRIRMAEHKESATVRDFLDQRDDTRRDQGDSLSDAERDAQAREDREADRIMGQDDTDGPGSRFDDDDGEPLEAEPLEGDDMGDTLEDIGDATDERLEEKMLENQTEAQAERAEGGGTGTGTP